MAQEAECNHSCVIRKPHGFSIRTMLFVILVSGISLVLYRLDGGDFFYADVKLHLDTVFGWFVTILNIATLVFPVLCSWTVCLVLVTTLQYWKAGQWPTSFSFWTNLLCCILVLASGWRFFTSGIGDARMRDDLHRIVFQAYTVINVIAILIYIIGYIIYLNSSRKRTQNTDCLSTANRITAIIWTVNCGFVCIMLMIMITQ